MKTIRLAMCQVQTEPEKGRSLAAAEEMVRRAAADGADLAVLPEMYFCPYVQAQFPRFAEDAQGEAVCAMSDWAMRYGILLVGGTLPEREGERLYNTSFVFDRSGALLARYRKVHLFDVALRDGTAFRESDTFAPGEGICVFDTEFGRMGLAICFDLRFPAQFCAMADRGAQLILVPAQFTVRTGALHWEKLVTMRALDQEIFVAGVSAARNPASGYACWGHSMLANPFGRVLAECGTGPECRTVEVDFEEIARVRAELPTFLHPLRELCSPEE